MFLPALFSCKTTEPLPAEPEPQKEELVQEDPPAVEEPVPVEPEVIIADPEPASENDGMVVSEDLYNRTFDEIEILIDEITKLIRKKILTAGRNFFQKST